MKQLDKFPTGIVTLIFLLSFLLLPQGTKAVGTNGFPQFEPVVINIPNAAEVDQEVVRLGDIAVFEGENEEYINALEEVVVGRIPALGKTLTIPRDVVVARINRISRPDQRAFLNMSGGINVKVAAREIKINEIAERVQDFFQKEYATDGSELDIVKIEIPEGLYVPKKEEVEFFFVVQRGSTGSKIVVKMDVVGSGGYRATQRIPVYINRVEETVVAARNISSREIIGPDDVKLVFVSTSTIRQKTFNDLDEVIGKAATTNIGMNVPITERNLKEIPVIARGAAISIVAEGKGFKISVPGVAKQNGFLGKTVRVENSKSQKTIYGKVVDSNTVLVQF